MKITKRQLRKLIFESVRDFRVKTVSDEQYEKDVASLPPSMQAIADGQEETATPKSGKYVVGNFFATQGVPYKPPKGYTPIKKFFSFYMVLPDGEALSIDHPNFTITKSGEALQFLSLLDQNVNVLPLDNLENVNTIRDQIQNVINMMRMS